MFICTARRLSLSRSVNPISFEEFASAITSTCSPRVFSRQTLALAISGGVDSMALAVMCKQYLGDIRLRAFIVDHGLRSNSLGEAEEVQRTLRLKLNIDAEILDANGLAKSLSNSSTRMETLAREFRYRMLAKACRKHDEDLLLLAHHQDDQAETIMFRLSKQSKFRLGVDGRQCDVPDCFGLYGLGRSGSPKDFPSHYRNAGGVKGFEDGGITIARPLLAFPKERLVATCMSHGIPWIEDETNHDKTLCSRNAIRFLLAHEEKLPPALRKHSLLQQHEKSLMDFEYCKNLARKLFNSCSIKLDPVIGVLHARLPRLHQPEMAYNNLPTQNQHGLDPQGTKNKISDQALYPFIYAILVQQLAELVNPSDGFDLSRALKAANIMFELNSEVESNMSTNKVQSKKFSLGQVLFQLKSTKTRPHGPESNPSHSSDGYGDPNSRYYWVLSRQPKPMSYSRGQSLVSSHGMLKIPGIRRRNGRFSTSGCELWDGRFWISVRKPPQYSLAVRWFTRADSLRLRSMMNDKLLHFKGPAKGPDNVQCKGKTWKDFEKACGISVDQLIRATVPILVYSPFTFQRKAFEGEEKDPHDRILAFPTLGIRIFGDIPSWGDRISCSVRYKKVDLGEHPLSKSLILSEKS